MRFAPSEGSCNTVFRYVRNLLRRRPPFDHALPINRAILGGFLVNGRAPRCAASPSYRPPLRPSPLPPPGPPPPPTSSELLLSYPPLPSPPPAGDFVASVLAVLRRLEGHFTLVFANADEPGTIVAARRSTPLVLGVGEGEMFVGSDVAAFIEHTREAVELGQDQAVVLTADDYRISDFHGNPDVRVPGVPYRLGPVRRGEGRL